MSSGRDASSSARRILAICRVFCTLSRRPSPVAKKRSRPLSLNDRITRYCKVSPYNRQKPPQNSGLAPKRDMACSSGAVWPCGLEKLGEGEGPKRPDPPPGSRLPPPNPNPPPPPPVDLPPLLLPPSLAPPPALYLQALPSHRPSP